MSTLMTGLDCHIHMVYKLVILLRLYCSKTISYLLAYLLLSPPVTVSCYTKYKLHYYYCCCYYKPLVLVTMIWIWKEREMWGSWDRTVWELANCHVGVRCTKTEHQWNRKLVLLLSPDILTSLRNHHQQQCAVSMHYCCCYSPTHLILSSLV